MYGYHGKRSLDFLRITMAMPRLIAPAKRLLEQGLKFGPFPLQCYQAFESNIDFEIRCVHQYQLCNSDLGDLLAVRKMLILQISLYIHFTNSTTIDAVTHCSRCNTQKLFSLNSLVAFSGLWWTLMWWGAAGLNFLKESIEYEKRKTHWSLILRTWAR